MFISRHQLAIWLRPSCNPFKCRCMNSLVTANATTTIRTWETYFFISNVQSANTCYRLSFWALLVKWKFIWLELSYCPVPLWDNKPRLKQVIRKSRPSQSWVLHLMKSVSVAPLPQSWTGWLLSQKSVVRGVPLSQNHFPDCRLRPIHVGPPLQWIKWFKHLKNT